MFRFDLNNACSTDFKFPSDNVTYFYFRLFIVSCQAAVGMLPNTRQQNISIAAHCAIVSQSFLKTRCYRSFHWHLL